MTEIRVDVHGRPVPQGSMRHVGRGRMVHSSSRLGTWREAVAWAVMAERPPGEWPDGESEWELQVEFRRLRPADLDKLVRAVCDALTGVLWADDRQVTAIAARRIRSRQEGATIVARRMTG